MDQTKFVTELVAKLNQLETNRLANWESFTVTIGKPETLSYPEEWSCIVPIEVYGASDLVEAGLTHISSIVDVGWFSPGALADGSPEELFVQFTATVNKVTEKYYQEIGEVLESPDQQVDSISADFSITNMADESAAAMEIASNVAKLLGGEQISRRAQASSGSIAAQLDTIITLASNITKMAQELKEEFAQFELQQDEANKWSDRLSIVLDMLTGIGTKMVQGEDYA